MAVAVAYAYLVASGVPAKRDGRHEGVGEGLGQGVGGRGGEGVGGADPEVVEALCPVVLVDVLGDDQLGCPGTGRRGGGARAAVVDDGGDSSEGCLLVDLVDGQAVGFAVQQGEVGPASGRDRAAAVGAGGADHARTQALRGPDAAEAGVDGRFTGVEELLQFRGRSTRYCGGIRQFPQDLSAI
nr:hypothetical protein [Streptomyces sp. SID12501]